MVKIHDRERDRARARDRDRDHDHDRDQGFEQGETVHSHNHVLLLMCLASRNLAYVDHNRRSSAGDVLHVHDLRDRDDDHRSAADDLHAQELLCHDPDRSHSLLMDLRHQRIHVCPPFSTFPAFSWAKNVGH